MSETSEDIVAVVMWESQSAWLRLSCRGTCQEGFSAKHKLIQKWSRTEGARRASSHTRPFQSSSLCKLFKHFNTRGHSFGTTGIL